MPDAAPHKSLARDIIISVFAASGLMTFIVQIAGQFAIDWIREGVETQGIQGFWLPIVVTLVIVLAAGTVLVLFALSLLRPRWRERVWVPALRWLWARRPVSALRFENELAATKDSQDALREQTNEALKREDAARKELARLGDASIDQVRTSLEKASLLLVTRQKEEQKRVDVLLREVEDLNKQQRVLQKQLADVRESAMVASVDETAMPESAPSSPSPPLPLPRWRLIDPRNRDDAHLEDGKFLILNLVEGSVAKNVRLDNDGAGYFDFKDGASWPQISAGDMWTFEGEIARTDRAGEVRLKLTWLDEENRQHSMYYWHHRDGTFRPIL